MGRGPGPVRKVARSCVADPSRRSWTDLGRWDGGVRRSQSLQRRLMSWEEYLILYVDLNSLSEVRHR
jgi:hypothetical protein